jgi:hypothetical protein
MDNDILDYVVLNPCWDLPYGTGMSYWDQAAAAMQAKWILSNKSHLHSTNVTGMGLHRRFDTLVKHFRDEDKGALYRSGTAEDYKKKELLLSSIVSELDAAILRKTEVL